MNQTASRDLQRLATTCHNLSLCLLVSSLDVRATGREATCTAIHHSGGGLEAISDSNGA